MSESTEIPDINSILNADPDNFQNLALEVFRYQRKSNPVYGAFCEALHIDNNKVKSLTQIPFLPISFFKTHRVIAGNSTAQLVFESSGTTGDIPSRHFVTDETVYVQSLLKGFREFYGYPGEFAFIALLPSYLERKNASLVHMAKTLMDCSQHPANGFYINEWDKLSKTLKTLEASGHKTLLLGVTFALLDFAEANPMTLRHTLVMETGGMKGRREELTRTAVHDLLKKQFSLSEIHSEYGMTELLSQAYAVKDGQFRCSSTMKVLVRDINDPMDVSTSGSGCLNIIDLANLNSCSFIATDDVGRLFDDRSFEVHGRLDHSDLRGCSLMVVE